MRYLGWLCVAVWLLTFMSEASAMLNLELTQGVAGAVPITIVPFKTVAATDITPIIGNDLQNSGRFKLQQDKTAVENIVTGEILKVASDQYKVTFQLTDATRGNAQQPTLLLKHSYTITSRQLRSVAHRISDLVYQQILGVRGVFSTRIAYVLVQHQGSSSRYILEVADQDGYNPRPLLTSNDPIMSPAWSPDGKRIAYVSFENRRAGIYIEDVRSGTRQLVSQFNGINGAPAWSPDGNKLALVLSKTGTPNIYILDLSTKRLTQITHDWSINTEPTWAPNGKMLAYTSTRGGAPQIYQMNLATHAVSRVSYDGDYNARPSYTADGNHIAMLHKENGVFNIGLLDLDNGGFHLLTNSANDNESPSIAPNGSMILYGALHNGKSVLGMVSSDGRVLLRLPARDGYVQDPAWSPFLT